ncbi:hypothetical protein [Falsiruegeria litorea]|uniref:hypothetical protein n=1 Tax=Falsiruegeria litorea TaxID=1280831 RepID=UPI001BFEABB7|nr:hypothetical protein [Falsiruegeria litorea]MBT8169868.1 hypothetical protein [Falsiruegeria litorea]
MTDAIVTEVRARLSGAFPAWHDATGQAHPTPDKQLPAFAVRVTFSDSERVGMGDTRVWRDGQIEVGIEARTPPNNEAGVHDLAGQVSQAILTPADDLGGAVWEITNGGFEADHDKGESPISRGDLIMPIRVLE